MENVHEKLKRFEKAAALVRTLNKLGATAEQASGRDGAWWAQVAEAAQVNPPKSTECVELVISLLPSRRRR